MNDSSDFTGYIQLSGSGVKNAQIDLVSASELLAGINMSLRYFISREDPSYSKLQYDLPVRIEPGSILVLLGGIAGIVGTAYLSGAANALAKNDVGQKSSSEVYQAATHSMKTIVKIAKHRGKLGKQQIDNPKFKDNNQIIGIPNSRGEYLYIKKDELETFLVTPEKLYEPIVKNVNETTSLVVAAKNNEGKLEKELIDWQTRKIFVSAEKDESALIILPELVDGMYVEIEGEMTRGNERSNTIGFEYKGHILICEPKEGSVRDYKEPLYGQALIGGRVFRNYKDDSRLDQNKRPRIIFDKLIPLNSIEPQMKLL